MKTTLFDKIKILLVFINIYELKTQTQKLPPTGEYFFITNKYEEGGGGEGVIEYHHLTSLLKKWLFYAS